MLTWLVDGVHIPLTTQEIASLINELKQEQPVLAEVLQDPKQAHKLNIPKLSESVPIYDHWEKAAKKVVALVMRVENTWIFHTPVDAEYWKIEDYHDIVKKPMDLGTVKQKLSDCEYKTMKEWYDDCNLVFDNCILYNGLTSDYGELASKTKSTF